MLKIKKHKDKEEAAPVQPEASEDMGAASMSPDDGMQDQMSGIPDENMEQDPMADDVDNDMEQDPMAGSQEEGDTDDEKKEIQSKTGELQNAILNYPEDDEELESYVKGMIDSAFEKNKEDDSADEEAPETEMATESVAFTKSQLNEVFKTLPDGEKEKEKNVPEKRTVKKMKETPFDGKRFK